MFVSTQFVNLVWRLSVHFTAVLFVKQQLLKQNHEYVWIVLLWVLLHYYYKLYVFVKLL